MKHQKLAGLLAIASGLVSGAVCAQAPGTAPPTPASLATATAPAADPLKVMAPPAATAPDVGPNAKAFTIGDRPPLPERPFSITKADPALDDIVAPDTKVELVNDQFGLTEGGVWIPEGDSGYLLVVDMLANAIYKITPDNKVSLFMYKAGYSGSDLLHACIQTRRGRANVLLIGPQVVTRDPKGNI